MYFAPFSSMKNRLVAATVFACGTVLVIAFAILASTEIDSARRSSLDGRAERARVDTSDSKLKRWPTTSLRTE